MWREMLKAASAGITGKMLTVWYDFPLRFILGFIYQGHFHFALTKLQCQLNTLGNSRPIAFPRGNSIHDNGNMMNTAAVKLRYFVNAIRRAIDTHTLEAGRANLIP